MNKTCKCHWKPEEDILVEDIRNPICPKCGLPLLYKLKRGKTSKQYLKEVQSRDSYRVTFSLGESGEMLTLVCWKDDGTWGKHLTVEYRDMPWSTFPIINDQGLLNLILALINMYEVYSGDKEFFKPLER